MSSAGANGGGLGGAVAEPIGLEPNVQTLWAMFAFEDPVAIELTASGQQLFGTGCFAGRAVQPLEGLDTCERLNGTIQGRHLEFAFPAERYTYAADVYVSSDQQRMAGRFHDTGGWRTQPTAWLPIGASDRWLPLSSAPTALDTVLELLAGRYALEAVDDAAAEPQHLDVRSGSTRGVIFSSLGAFWHTEVSWNEQEQILTAGPVPETAPDLPIQLELQFDTGLLVQVEALAPTGEVRVYTAERSLP